MATIDQMPVANAGPDQTLALQFSTTLAAVLGENESGIWKVSSGTGTFADTTNPGSVVEQSVIRNKHSVMDCYNGCMPC